MARKGFPESYDRRALLEFVAAVKSGSECVQAPVYSHTVYDIVLGQRQRRRGRQGGPLVPVQLNVGRGARNTQVTRVAQLGCHRHSVANEDARRTIPEE